MKMVLYDPPGGWKYGFPKEGPSDLFLSEEHYIKSWFRKNGYPQSLIDQGMLKHCRVIREGDKSSKQ